MLGIERELSAVAVLIRIVLIGSGCSYIKANCMFANFLIGRYMGTVLSSCCVFVIGINLIGILNIFMNSY